VPQKEKARIEPRFSKQRASGLGYQVPPVVRVGGLITICSPFARWPMSSRN